MANTPRSAQSGRFVKKSSKAAAQIRSIRSYFAPTPARVLAVPPQVAETPSDTIASTVSTSVPDSIGRPPSKLSLQPDNTIHEVLNGVTSVITISDDDLKTAPESSRLPSRPLVLKDEQHIVPSKKESDKRVLRSKDGSSRITSELSRFFADYEEVVFGPPKEPDTLTPETILFIVDKKNKISDEPQQLEIPDPQQEASDDDITSHKSPARSAASYEPRDETIDLSVFEADLTNDTEDPLADALYQKGHKRAERREKQLRNIEKEHALHEKAELERILEDLNGAEWIKAMGIGNVTDVERKKYAVHRNYYINRVKALLDKFTAWKDQERELRVRKEAQAAQDEEDEEDEEEEEEEEEEDPETSISTGPSDPSARQLHMEARSANQPIRKITLKLSQPPAPPEPEKPFTSFYSKPHLRKAALGKHRRGRSVTAFGLPLPEMGDQEFTLPEDYVSEEALIANARKRRRLRRESHLTEHDV